MQKLFADIALLLTISLSKPDIVGSMAAMQNWNDLKYDEPEKGASIR